MAGPRLAVALTLRDTVVVDAAAQYRHLVGLGKDEFLAAAAPAALVRYRAVDLGADSGDQTLTIDDAGQETMPIGKVSLGDVINIEVYPLVKKPGASFPDRITIGRTANNDIVLAEASISRLHAYLRRQGAGWVVADGGSKNGSWLRGETLEPRREKPITSRTVLRLGDVDLTFYLAPDLYGVLGGV
ncbi:MAG: FHA domain-containing protein [Deltaproteobacteria bacterium]|nr:FHA domain-containing protein [Deltaproteobacteria bacterium]MDQ3300556.1 FHA domain-containing protein [Myxococcota bacterium]